MERNTQTEAKNLRIGDRFYKVTDKGKKVWEMAAHESKQTKYRTYNYWCKGDTDKFPSPINHDTQVIFLRHAGSNATTTAATN